MESIEDIYKKHSKTVYAFLLTKTKDPHLAEEIAQETFFQAVNSIGSFKGNSRISVGTFTCNVADFAF